MLISKVLTSVLELAYFLFLKRFSLMILGVVCKFCIYFL